MKKIMISTEELKNANKEFVIAEDQLIVPELVEMDLFGLGM